MFSKISIIVLSTTVLLVSCATTDPNRRAKTGAAIGAVAGAVLGHQLDDDKGRYVGAVVGAVTGGAVGNYMDRQEQDFNRALQEEQRQHDLEIERLKDDTLKLSLNNEVSFDFDSARIKPAFYDTLDKLAGVLRKYDRTVVHIVGHTDSTGSDAYNQRLSQKRAAAVGQHLTSSGVPATRVRTEGRGESEPRASNATVAGQQLNRRVEVYVKPIIEGREGMAYESPQYN